MPRCSNDVGETEQHASTSIRGNQRVTSATPASAVSDPRNHLNRSATADGQRVISSGVDRPPERERPRRADRGREDQAMTLPQCPALEPVSSLALVVLAKRLHG